MFSEVCAPCAPDVLALCLINSLRHFCREPACQALLLEQLCFGCSLSFRRVLCCGTISTRLCASAVLRQPAGYCGKARQRPHLCSHFFRKVFPRRCRFSGQLFFQLQRQPLKLLMLKFKPPSYAAAAFSSMLSSSSWTSSSKTSATSSSAGCNGFHGP